MDKQQHNHLTLRKWCYTPLEHDFALDPIIPPFDFHFRIYKRDNRPSRNNSRLRLWTNNNCESMNHRFKLATDWKPQHLPGLINTIVMTSVPSEEITL
jgi:hypothetical protein